MTNRHTWMRRTAVAIMAGAGLWWTVHVPYRADAVFSAIPANAAVVTVHENLARDITGLLRHPMLRGAIASAGIREADVNGFASNSAARAYLRDLATHGTVIGYVPAFGYQSKPAWVFASWIGGQSITLRWKLRWARPNELRAVSLGQGRTVWMLRTKLDRPDQYVSLALVDGLVLGCLSSDPIGARWLIETHEGQPFRPSVLLPNSVADARVLLGSSGPQWGWIRVTEPLSPLAGRLIAFKLDLPEAGPASLRVRGRNIWPSARPCVAESDCTDLAAWLGITPALVAFMPASWTHALLSRPPSPLWVDALNAWLGDGVTPDAPVFVAVLNRDHSGRIKSAFGKSLAALMGKGLRVPTVLAGIRLPDAEQATPRVDRVLSILNSRYGLNLATRPTSAEWSGMAIIGETSRSFYGKLEPHEQAAYAVWRNWLILCSNADTLRSLLSRSDTEPERHRLVPTDSNATAYAWSDLASFGRTVRELVAVGQLALFANESGASTELRQGFADAQFWADRLSEIGEASIAVRASDTNTDLVVTLGRKDLRLR